MITLNTHRIAYHCSKKKNVSPHCALTAQANTTFINNALYLNKEDTQNQSSK